MKNVICYMKNLALNGIRAVRYCGYYKMPFVASFEKAYILIFFAF